MSFCFLLTSYDLQLTAAHAQEIRLPAPGVMVHLSPDFNPPVLKGVTVDLQNPFKFDFVLDQGDSTSPEAKRESNLAKGDYLKSESAKLVKYFLASITTPERDLWVNLSPYEKNRIIPDSFGQTDMGRDLLAQDYILKQVTSSLIYPEDEFGKKFWKRVYEEAAQKFGTTNIPVNTFNKVWIVPDEAKVYEHGNTAFVVKARLKVMLEEDYLSQQKHNVETRFIASSKRDAINLPAGRQVTVSTNQIGSQIIREIVIPQLEKEVNEGKNFAPLRQVYNSLILAVWFKKRMKESILGRKYMDQNKIANLSSPNASVGDPESIYQRYLQAFKKGVYNYIKEEPDPITNQMTPRKYFSGGFGDVAKFAANRIDYTRIIEPNQISNLNQVGKLEVILADQKMAAKQAPQDRAELVEPVLHKDFTGVFRKPFMKDTSLEIEGRQMTLIGQGVSNYIFKDPANPIVYRVSKSSALDVDSQEVNELIEAGAYPKILQIGQIEEFNWTQGRAWGILKRVRNNNRFRKIAAIEYVDGDDLEALRKKNMSEEELGEFITSFKALMNKLLYHRMLIDFNPNAIRYGRLPGQSGPKQCWLVDGGINKHYSRISSIELYLTAIKNDITQTINLERLVASRMNVSLWGDSQLERRIVEALNDIAHELKTKKSDKEMAAKQTPGEGDNSELTKFDRSINIDSNESFLPVNLNPEGVLVFGAEIKDDATYQDIFTTGIKPRTVHKSGRNTNHFPNNISLSLSTDDYLYSSSLSVFRGSTMVAFLLNKDYVRNHRSNFHLVGAFFNNPEYRNRYIRGLNLLGLENNQVEKKKGYPVQDEILFEEGLTLPPDAIDAVIVYSVDYEKFLELNKKMQIKKPIYVFKPRDYDRIYIKKAVEKKTDKNMNANTGGIDLTDKQMKLDVDSDKVQITEVLDLKALENMEINALYIKSIELKPLNNLKELLGVK